MRVGVGVKTPTPTHDTFVNNLQQTHTTPGYNSEDAIVYDSPTKRNRHSRNSFISSIKKQQDILKQSR